MPLASSRSSGTRFPSRANPGLTRRWAAGPANLWPELGPKAPILTRTGEIDAERREEFTNPVQKPTDISEYPNVSKFIDMLRYVYVLIVISLAFFLPARASIGERHREPQPHASFLAPV